MSQGELRVPLNIAKKAAEVFLGDLLANGLVLRAEIAGSIRRKKETVGDIDLVLIPNPKNLFAWADRFGKADKVIYRAYAPVSWSYERSSHVIQHELPVDIYWATEPQWATILLIRTGSKEHNIMLCNTARGLGMKLHADGSGLEDSDGTLFQSPTEKHIFERLQMYYREPEDREVQYV